MIYIYYHSCDDVTFKFHKLLKKSIFIHEAKIPPVFKYLKGQGIVKNFRQRALGLLVTIENDVTCKGL